MAGRRLAEMGSAFFDDLYDIAGIELEHIFYFVRSSVGFIFAVETLFSRVL